MYEPFFGLDSSPFGLTPDPRFLFRSRVHHEILSLLLYGVTTGKGVMLLLGDVGTGKTTLCRALLRELPAEAQSVLLLNPHLSETELVGAILDDLDLERRGSARGGGMDGVHHHLPVPRPPLPPPRPTPPPPGRVGPGKTGKDHSSTPN